ncbi:MAG: hypothetical protein IPO76_06435 [Elusimicrobia bacterium]|nr:hypothetical protein [Elusimicrobiota bacterium]
MRLVDLMFACTTLMFAAPGLSEERDLVPSAEVAIAIATAVWVPLYGAEHVDRYKPYSAISEKGTWVVTGTPPEGITRGGGSPEATVSKKDGRITGVHLAK